jgi:hypothetical protein
VEKDEPMEEDLKQDAKWDLFYLTN